MNSMPNGKATESDDISIVVTGRLPLRGGSALLVVGATVAVDGGVVYASAGLEIAG